jgi:predicted lipoprotein with Yx(FWY)xxD motif
MKEVQMQRIALERRVLILLAALVGAALAASAAGAGLSARVRLVTTAKNAGLGKTVLVDRKGLTLYSLSVERHGRFICSNASCLSLWRPLVVAKGTTPSGVSGLGTVARPDKRIQVTYRGAPLYTFYLDRKRGDHKGEGFKDVGTWHAASPGGQAAAPEPPPTTTGGYGGGYG